MKTKNVYIYRSNAEFEGLDNPASVSGDPLLKAISKCVYGTVARVVYSRMFPDWTMSKMGRLNKSPHTVHAFANRHKGFVLDLENYFG